MTRSEDWAAERSAAASARQAHLEARQDAQHREAEALLAAFAAAATRAGLPTERLRMRGYGGSRSARTHLHGWYLRRDRRAALDAHGNFYLLLAPLSLLDVMRGVRPCPSRPPMVLGAGGRDGDSLTLHAALERLLPGWQTRAGR